MGWIPAISKWKAYSIKLEIFLKMAMDIVIRNLNVESRIRKIKDGQSKNSLRK
ncbi:MAG: hypothetical protein HOH18_07810 [Kordiimonadaceae bacterium]|nr:hypothetical protein [Kordiimonadaceae bacterium]MBT6036365.1 hypothetical protein [Kordiimonadaceae bacterium]MBT7582656.1 hypothetical protein [Kordiimonadaceae bacterium]